jgi:prepilin-type processing-associated H-X9-DG protein
MFQKYEPLARARQVIHNDMGGNILFADGLKPLVIDFSPAYGSSEYAEAILVADAIAWEKAPVELMRELSETWNYRQLLLRAVNFRLIAVALLYPLNATALRLEYENFAPLIDRLV